MPTYLGVKGTKLSPAPTYIGGRWRIQFQMENHLKKIL